MKLTTRHSVIGLLAAVLIFAGSIYVWTVVSQPAATPAEEQAVMTEQGLEISTDEQPDNTPQPGASPTSKPKPTPKPDSPEIVPNENGKQPNRLINEKSPYLLQHAYNPIDWYPWGEEAFEKARREKKPIFLSIGYSTCHWCHVMEEETFEDPDVARLMNETFVSIKVDREERPDIDSIYMNVAVMMNGSGGWPLNIFMTPDQKPFFAATYIPKETRFGRMGMMELVPQVQEAWLADNDALLDMANQVAEVVEASANIPTAGQLAMDETLLEGAYQQFATRFDAERGGFGESQKFPSPHNLLFLLRYWKRTGDETALLMVETTLQAMRRGGMYDQLGYGFHRYSTDPDWLVPHFEKMLYDQAMLAMAYTEAYQATGNPEYQQTAREIFAYVLRDMTAPNGGFYSAEDADSEGEEGKFYMWTADEIRQVLGPEDANLILASFNVVEEGNFTDPLVGHPTGANILHLTKPLSEIATDLHLSEEEFVAQLGAAREQLFTERETRIHPHKDDKILTDWNGLMIAALAKAGRAFDEPQYIAAAEQAADFILQEMRTDDGRLLHRYRDGEAILPANIDDYAFLTWGLLELYETTFNVDYLDTALTLTNDMSTHFWDEENSGFYFTPDDGETLLVRKKEIYDGAVPSGNSAAMLNLLRLGRITANPELEEQAVKIGYAFAEIIQQEPSAYAQLMSGVDFGVGPSFEVVVVGQPEAEDTQAMLAALNLAYVPNKVVLLRTPGESPEILRLAEYTKYHFLLNDQATAYVCKNYYCELPTNDVEKMLELLGKS